MSISVINDDEIFSHEVESKDYEDVTIVYGKHVLNSDVNEYLRTQVDAASRYLEIPENRVVLIIEHSGCQPVGNMVFRNLQTNGYDLLTCSLYTSLLNTYSGEEINMDTPPTQILDIINSGRDPEFAEKIRLWYLDRIATEPSYTRVAYIEYQKLKDRYGDRIVFEYENREILSSKADHFSKLRDIYNRVTEIFASASTIGEIDYDSKELLPVIRDFKQECIGLQTINFLREHAIADIISRRVNEGYKVVVQLGKAHQGGIEEYLSNLGLNVASEVSGDVTVLEKISRDLRQEEQDIDWRDYLIDFWREQVLLLTD